MTADRQQCIYVEVDVDRCSLTYGDNAGGCSAVLGQTGQAKCYNTFATCQVPGDFLNRTRTLRFVQPSGHEPLEIDAIPSIASVSTAPAKIRPGEDLGERATIDVSFYDHPFNDDNRNVDPYARERISGAAQADGVGYDPAKRGTFWGKFRARQPYYRGRGLRLIMGTADQTLDQMETRHYVIESVQGPTQDGQFTITAQDVLKLADDDRAQAPRASEGTLAQDISETATTISLSPSGAIDDYPYSGTVTIGNEVCSYRKDNGQLSITRGQEGTEPDTHRNGDTVQLSLVYDGRESYQIIRDLLTQYAGVPSEYIDSFAWQNEDRTYINRLYGAVITEPTSVRELIGQLCKQVGLTIWWDEVRQTIRFKAIRQPEASPAVLTDDSDFISGSLSIKEQPKKRVSRIWVYYGVIDPTEDIDEPRNYRSVYVLTDADAESEDQYNEPQIEKIYARWISRFNQPAAADIAARTLSRYRDPPRQFSFATPWLRSQIALGGAYDVQTRLIQSQDGTPKRSRVLVLSYERNDEQIEVETEEFFYQPPPDLAIKRVVIDADAFNVNARSAFNEIYPRVTSGDDVEIIVENGVIVGSTSTQQPALDIGTWPSNVNIELIIRGRIQGAGGNGGNGTGSGTAEPGVNGGNALRTRYPISLQSSGEIWAGGGGGGGGRADEQTNSEGGGGGGGAGFEPGDIGSGGNNGTGTRATTESGGEGNISINTNGDFGNGGRGGDPAQAGERGGDGARGGSAGNAIDGASYVTFDSFGDIRGAQIN